WESTLEGSELDGQENDAGPEDTEGPERRPVPLGGSSGRRWRSSDHLASTVAVLVIVVIAAFLWWFVDGERRFSSRGGGSVRTEHEGVVEDRETELQDDRLMPLGGMDEAATTELSADREVAAADGEEPSGGGTTPAGQREASGEEISAGAGADDSSFRPAHERLDADTVISGPGGPYHIMISSHRYEGAAVFEAGQLIERGVAAEVMATKVEGRGIWFRVVVSGGYPALSRARENLDTIKFLGYEGAWIEHVADNE
ncbi:MAG: SPOR domain-containing protein, partial [Candidatus Eisenbacteria sp.]|nr:SPOR domain-containing protein [Candidatus Eisenbacteria bacterium]